MPAEWRGSQLAAEASFLLLVKFIFPTEKLSLQVHPDDAYASVHEKSAGGRGKTEMWHAVSALAGAQLQLGLKPGVDQEKFRAGLASHTLEDLFEVQPVRTGDTFFRPCGHAPLHRSNMADLRSAGVFRLDVPRLRFRAR